jgi:hypothetical protein
VQLPPATQPTCSTPWSRTQSGSCACGPASASPAPCQIASTAPVERRVPNSSDASSAVPRREIRLRAVSVTTAACKFAPNARSPTPAGNPTVVVARHSGQRMRAMLDQDHADRRQLGHLVGTETSTRLALPDGEVMAAPATGAGIVIDDLIHLILRPQLPARASMPWLPAGLALPAQQLLGLALASARRCCRVLGGSADGNLELVRESCRACSSSRLSRSSTRCIRAARSRMNCTHTSRPAS